MKNINVRKVVAGVAALGISAMFAGAVVAANVTDATWTAPNALTKADLFTNGVPAYNIVLGSMAMPVDVVWAGNIAAAIGKKAYTTTSAGGSATLGDVVVELGTSGDTTISGDGKLFDDDALGGTAATNAMDKDDYSLLFDEDVSIDDDQTGVTDDKLNVQDTLTLVSTTQFDDDTDIGALTTTFDKNGINYLVEFDDNGIPYGYTDGSPDLKFKFFGKTYTVDSLNASGNTLTLVESLATVTYSEGETFNVGAYKVEITEVLDNGSQEDPYEVNLTLYDSTDVVVATDVYQAGDEDIFEDYLGTAVDVDTVYATKVKFVIGASGKIELKDGYEIENFPESGDELWKVEFGGTSSLTSIEVYNNDASVQYEEETALKVGDSIELPNGFAKIEFLGLTEEAMTDFTVGDNYISYTDTSDEDHALFMYDYDTGADIETWTTDETIDGKKLFLDINTEDVNVPGGSFERASGSLTIQLEDEDGKYLTEAGQWSTTATTWYFGVGDATNGAMATAFGTYDSNSYEDVDQWFDLNIAAYNNENVEYTYGLFMTESSDAITHIALGIKNDTNYPISGGDATWAVMGVSADVTTAYNDDLTYVGSKADENTIVEDDLQSIAEVTLYDSTDTIKAYVDTYTGDLADTEDTVYEAGSVQVDAVKADLGIHDSDDLTEAYTDFGTFFKIDDGLFTSTVPENRLYPKIFVGGGSSSETTLNGGNVTLTTPGTVVTTEDGTISAKLISGDVIGGSTGTAITPAVWNVGTNRLVYLDNESPAGAMIIVGGFVVNTLAQTTYGLEDKLVQSGNYVVGKATNGNIIVAGTDAADTALAAKELIAAIENM